MGGGDEGESVKRSTWTGGLMDEAVTSSDRKRRCDWPRRSLPRSLLVPHVRPLAGESKAPPPVVDEDIVEVGEAVNEAGPPSRRSVIL